jgi:riboflavin kinase/FMN adenylyltransferase
MLLVRHLAHVEVSARPRVVASGGFDGVHRGHQRVLGRLAAVARARRAEAVVAVRPRSGQPLLANLRQQLALLSEWSVDSVVLLGGGDPADEGTVAERLDAAVLVTGGAPTFTGGEVESVERVIEDGELLSADLVRTRLAAGDLAAVERALGRCHAVEGPVVHGFHRGATIGIPTANLRVRRQALPPDGVYAVRVRHRGRELNGAANIGYSPTFGNATRSVETHVLDFDGNLYGERLEIAFVARLRGEEKFASIDALVARIREDIAAARTLLSARGNGG